MERCCPLWRECKYFDLICGILIEFWLFWWENDLLIYLKMFWTYFFGLYFLLSGLFDYYIGYGLLRSPFCAYLEVNLWLVGFNWFPLLVWMRSQEVSNLKYFILFFVFNDWIIIRQYILLILAPETGTWLFISMHSQVVLRHFES